jgi:hypothetical protein
MHIIGGADHGVDQAEAASTIWQRIPKNHWFPLPTECISGSRWRCLCLVELVAWMIAHRGWSLLQQGAVILERLLHRLQNLLPVSVLLEQMTKLQNRSLIWNPIRDPIDPRKAPETGVSINIFSINGSDSVNHCCSKWMRSINSNGNGALSPLADGWW